MFYCGIDIAKYKHEASVIDTNGKAMLDSISFTNDKQGCEKILATDKKHTICFVEGFGKPSQKQSYNTFKTILDQVQL